MGISLKEFLMNRLIKELFYFEILGTRKDSWHCTALSVTRKEQNPIATKEMDEKSLKYYSNRRQK